MEQKTKTRLTLAGAITAAGTLAVAVVGNYEGLRLYAYKDVVGVWTACYGETKNIHAGMKFTKEQCDIIFIESLTKHEQGMRACLRRPDDLSIKTYVSMLSVTYNIGISGFCHSSMARDLNAGRVLAACDDLLKWNKAGGRVVTGLTNRRRTERALCRDGFGEPAISVAIAEPPVVEPTPVEIEPTPVEKPVVEPTPVEKPVVVPPVVEIPAPVAEPPTIVVEVEQPVEKKSFFARLWDKIQQFFLSFIR